MTPLLPKVIIRLMRWLAKKTRNATSPLNIKELCRQFQDETGSLVSETGLEKRIHRYRQKIHEIDEFDVETKVKMMFALSAPIDQGFLAELKKVADVEVDDKPRIIYYKQKDGGLELNAKNLIPSMKEEEQRSRSMIQFLAEKTKTVDFPMVDRAFLRDFKENDGCHDAIWCLVKRYERVKKTIFNSFEFDKNTKVKMMFISNAILTDDILEELQKDAIVELDEKQRIKKYRSNDGSLELQGDHSMSTRVKTAIADMKKKRTRVIADSSDSERDKRNRKRRGRTFDQAPTSLPTRSSESIKKSAIPTQNTPNSSQTRTPTTKVTGRNKPRSSSSEDSDDVPSDQEDDDEKSITREDDSSKVSEVDNTSVDDMDYDAPVYNTEDLEHAPTEPKSQGRIETLEVMGEEKEEAGPSSSDKIETMSLLEFLNHFRAPILQFTPTLAPKIDETIKKLEEDDQEIPVNIILDSLDMCIQILNTNDEMDSDNETISLPDFFYRLGMALLNIPHSSMDDFHVKITKLATTGNKKVSLEHIRFAMEQTLDKIIR